MCILVFSEHTVLVLQDKVHIPGAIYLSIKFDPMCNTEEGCDELVISSSSDFKQDLHRFSGLPKRWIDFELPGEYDYRCVLPVRKVNMAISYTKAGH